jgi:hypothetical protein
MGTSMFGRRVVEYIQTLPDFPGPQFDHVSYRHMGATLCDAGLQAGLKYDTVVAPRVRCLLATWPDATTTSAFIQATCKVGLQAVLSWQHHEKLIRIMDWAYFFLCETVETEFDLRDWLHRPTNCDRFRCRRGVGPKTLDYIKILVGLPAVAVDRHLRAFVADAGVSVTEYNDVQRVIECAAENLHVSSSQLDYRIWLHMSSKAQRGGSLRMAFKCRATKLAAHAVI